MAVGSGMGKKIRIRDPEKTSRIRNNDKIYTRVPVLLYCLRSGTFCQGSGSNSTYCYSLLCLHSDLAIF